MVHVGGVAVARTRLPAQHLLVPWSDLVRSRAELDERRVARTGDRLSAASGHAAEVDRTAQIASSHGRALLLLAHRVEGEVAHERPEITDRVDALAQLGQPLELDADARGQASTTCSPSCQSLMCWRTSEGNSLKSRTSSSAVVPEPTFRASACFR